MPPQVTLYAMGIAPNPPKVAILLEELGIEYAVVHKVHFYSLTSKPPKRWRPHRREGMALVAWKAPISWSLTRECNLPLNKHNEYSTFFSFALQQWPCPHHRRSYQQRFRRLGVRSSTFIHCWKIWQATKIHWQDARRKGGDLAVAHVPGINVRLIVWIFQA